MAEGTVLVIDDELVMCELLSDVLKDRGFSVQFCLSGQEGTKTAQANDFDVLITDLKMPDMDGIQVVKNVCKSKPDSVAIVITGYPSFETVQAALREGAYDYITKPFNIDEIIFRIKRAVVFRKLTLTNKQLMEDLENQNIKLEKAVKERTKELTLIYQVGRDISATLKLDEVLSTILDRISSILDLEICSILLIDKKTKVLSIRAANGLNKKIISQTKLEMGEAISGWVAQHKESVLVDDIEKDPRFIRRNKEKYYTHSFISVPLMRDHEVIGVININNKKTKKPFTKDDFRFVEGVASEATIAIENARLYTSLQDTYMRTVMALTSAIDARDHYTKTHSEHVTYYAGLIATEMGLPEDATLKTKQACRLHDLGKLGVHDSVLTKPGKLTPGEWEEMRLHPLKSAEILRPLVFLNGVIKLVEQHHERYDGKGYPYKLKGDEITLGARIIAVADSFDAMTTDRPYRKALPKEKAVEELKQGKGNQFDPEVVDAFLKVLEKSRE